MTIVPHLLLIEDEPALRFTLEAILEYGGFTCEAAASALEALERLKNQRFTAILMDLGLPDVDGAHLITTIRASSDIPILVVSGRQNDKVTALDLGADDFVTKPFLPDELLARIRAVLRRPRSDEMPFILSRPGSSPDAQSGKREEMERSLRNGTLEAKLFSFLQKRPDEIVPTEELITALWGENSEEANNHLRVLITKLRSKLKEHGDRMAIVNEWGHGYRLCTDG